MNHGEHGEHGEKPQRKNDQHADTRNTVVLALRTPVKVQRAALADRAETIETRWGLPARKWLRVFKPV